MIDRYCFSAALAVVALVFAPTSWADNQAVAIDEMEGYLAFADYGGGVIFAEQIPRDDWARMLVLDVRDAAQFAKAHIPGAFQMDWRQVLTQRQSIPRDRLVLLYCNTGSLSAQAGFALRVAGWDNVRILQGGFDEWNAKGGFDASNRSHAGPTH